VNGKSAVIRVGSKQTSVDGLYLDTTYWKRDEARGILLAWL